jgi:hypothetical protein
MAARKRLRPAPPAEPPKIHEATLASGPSGAVIRGPEIDQATAIARRQAGDNVVVCGNALRANRNLARAIEAAVGPYERHEPHDMLAGSLALPHFQQQDRAHGGHSFYETENRKARATP